MNVRILREAGGLGDVLCTLPVARAVKEKWPEAKVYYFGLEDYRDVAEHSPDVDVFIPVTMEERRDRDTEPDPKVYPYLAAPDLPAFDMTIDLWCPAFRYEKEKGHALDRSRIESFCAAAGLTPSDYLPRYVMKDEERAWARGWTEAQKPGAGDKTIVVGLAPFCTNNNRRDWPAQNWIDLSNTLQKQGATVLVFHTYAAKVKDIPGRKVTGMPIARFAAILAECNCLVTPDSGGLHLAAAVGVPAIGLFGSTHGTQIAKHYPLHKVIWPKDAARKQKCDAPCMGFQWAGCDEKCHVNGCEILSKVTVQEVLEAVGKRANDR